MSNSSPAVADGVVYVGSFDRKLYAFSAQTGQTIWSAATGNYIQSSPAVASGVVYLGSADNNLYAFNAATGQRIWTAGTYRSVLSSPAVANGVVYVGSYDGKLCAFNATTGQTIWSAATGESIPSSPAVANGVVYVGSLRQRYLLLTSSGERVRLRGFGNGRWQLVLLRPAAGERSGAGRTTTCPAGTGHAQT